MGSITWVQQIFDADQAYTGGSVRRSKEAVHRIASREMLIDAVKSRGFHLLETETNYIIVCDDDPVQFLF